MMKTKVSILAACLVAVAFAAGAVMNSSFTPAVAGDGCCADKAGATTSAVATVTPVANADGEKAACPYTKAAGADKASCNLKNSSMPASVKASFSDFSSSNRALARAVDSGASAQQIKSLADRAGRDYSAYLQEAAKSYSGSPAGTARGASFASWVRSGCPGCDTGSTVQAAAFSADKATGSCATTKTSSSTEWAKSN